MNMWTKTVVMMLAVATMNGAHASPNSAIAAKGETVTTSKEADITPLLKMDRERLGSMLVAAIQAKFQTGPNGDMRYQPLESNLGGPYFDANETVYSTIRLAGTRLTALAATFDTEEVRKWNVMMGLIAHADKNNNGAQNAGVSNKDIAPETNIIAERERLRSLMLSPKLGSLLVASIHSELRIVPTEKQGENSVCYPPIVRGSSYSDTIETIHKTVRSAGKVLTAFADTCEPKPVQVMMGLYNKKSSQFNSFLNQLIHKGFYEYISKSNSNDADGGSN